MNSLFFRRLRTLLIFEIGSFEEQLQQLLAVDYPTEVASGLIRELQKELSDQRITLDQISDDYLVDPKGASDRLQSEHRKTTYRYTEYVAALEDAQTQRVPWGFVPGIESIAQVLSPNRKLLTSSIEAFTYEIRYRPGDNAGGVSGYNGLFVPALHRFDSLLHILVGHELFHPVLERFFVQEQPKVLEKLRVACEPLISQEASGPLFEASRLDQLVEMTRNIWFRAMEEIMCDLGCSALFGPAGLLSAWSFAIGRNLDQPPHPQYRFYPPWRYRIRSMVKYGFESGTGAIAINALLSELKSNLAVEQVAKVFEDWYAAIKAETSKDDDLKALNGSPFLKIAYSQVESSMPEAWKFVSKLVDDGNISWTTSHSQIPTLVTLLQNLVPPSEIRSNGHLSGSPPTLAAIAGACWLFYLQLEQENEAGTVTDYERCCRLMLKAFEDAELKRRYSATP